MLQPITERARKTRSSGRILPKRAGGVDEPLVEGTTLTVAAVWQAFQRVRGDRRGFRARTPGLTEDQRMAVVRFVGKYPHYVLPPSG